jgi:hypothetical protein
MQHAFVIDYGKFVILNKTCPSFKLVYLIYEKGSFLPYERIVYIRGKKFYFHCL